MEEKTTMDDYKDELEASFRQVQEGDVLTGTVIGVSESEVTVDLKYYTEGIIRLEDYSDDPAFSIKADVQVTATVLRTDDGQGHILLSRKAAAADQAWKTLVQYLEDKSVLTVKVGGIVKAGVVAYVEGIRGFIPASRLSDEYVEDLKEFDGKTIEVTVITADEETHRLVLSGREAAREKKQEETNKKIAKCEVGAVMNGTVETLKDYGAFVNLENGLSGLLHVSQISNQRIKHPGVVLKEGQNVTVKVTGVKDGKISLSMKALTADGEPEEPVEKFEYKETGEATTGLGALLKGLKF